MAQGDLTLFNQFKEDLIDGLHDLDNDVIKVCFISNATVPTATDAVVTKATYTEVSGGNFTLGGETMTVTTVESAGTVTVDFTTDISNLKNASNPNNVYYALIYNDTEASDSAIGFVEIAAGGFDATGGDLTLTWGANIFTLA